jgi:hypothetical protein
MHTAAAKPDDFQQHGLTKADHAAYAQAEDMLWILLEDLLKPDDRPEIWAAFPQFLSASFTVQAENFHEMGEGAALAESLNATSIYFGKITNWGTFSPEQYAAKAVFLPDHPQHAAFLAAMADPRLRSPRVQLGNLVEYLPANELAA